MDSTDLQYTYPAQNAGQITKMKDLLSGGQEVNYSYDSLGRLSTAATTSTAWGQSFVYDGWGNRTDQLVTKGSAPVISVTVDPATNRINSTGYVYDGAGNMTKMPKGAGYIYLTYDGANRATVTHSTPYANDGERYGYAPDNRRLYRNTIGTDERVMFWLGGQLLVELTPQVDGNGWWSGFWSRRTHKYFGGRRLGEVNDRLGSTVNSHKTYYPYGQETTVAGDGGYKFGTYYRDSWTGLDYADQRYYASGLGRFMTADPYVPSGGVGNPGSWNRYAYVVGDPVNRYDPTGYMPLLPGEGNDPSDPLAQEEYGCIDNDPAVNDWILTIADASEPGSHRLHCKTHVPLRLINSDGGSITCRGTARVLQGNAATIGKPGGFSGPSAGTIPVTAEGAAIIVSQWGMSKSQLRPFLSDISGVFPNVNASFVGVVDIVGGTPPPGFTNVQTALMTLYPGQLIIELPGAPKDYGVTAVIIAVPTVVGCPKGTVQVPR